MLLQIPREDTQSNQLCSVFPSSRVVSKGASLDIHAVPPFGIKVQCEGGLAGRLDFVLPRTCAADLDHRTCQILTRSFQILRPLSKPCGARPHAFLQPNQGATVGAREVGRGLRRCFEWGPRAAGASPRLSPARLDSLIWIGSGSGKPPPPPAPLPPFHRERRPPRERSSGSRTADSPHPQQLRLQRQPSTHVRS